MTNNNNNKSTRKKTPKKGSKDLVQISNRVKDNLTKAVDKITPWFFKTLPPFYYQVTSNEEQIKHLHAVISLKQTNTASATLTNPDNKTITFISIADRDNQLVEALQGLSDVNIKAANAHMALEGDLMINTFFKDIELLDTQNEEVQKKIAKIKKELGKLSDEETAKADDFINGMSQQYFERYEVPMISRHIRFYMQIQDYETVFDLDNKRDKNFTRLSLCTNNPPKTQYLLKIVKILIIHGIKINRLYANLIPGKRYQERIIISLYGVDEKGKKIQEDSLLWKRIKSAVRTVKWVEEDELSVLIGRGKTSLSVRKINFLRSAAVFVHQFLAKNQVELYTFEVVKKTFIRWPELTNLIVHYFYARFHPNIDQVERHLNISPGSKNSVEKDLNIALKQIKGSSGDIYHATMKFIDHLLKERRKIIQKKIKEDLHKKISKVDRFVDKEIFNAAIHFIDHILKTNYFIEESIGLAYRMDPRVLSAHYYDIFPYGFFFFCGRGYKGYHVRFKDMSRGGFRLVRSRDKEHYDFESARVFDEVYHLAKAQQLKNKDIPEGGSKAIALLLPGAVPRECVECTIDSLLDLLVMDQEGQLHPKIVDYYGKEEIIYLGPDENITDDLIEWIVERAKTKQYKYPNAFMSSKPGMGINHKEFGVTSQGVNVYVEACLRYLKINPKQDAFTVRIVGGPDGDVAGNEIKILVNTYPNVKIVAVSDGGGAAYDRNGLNKDELLRLVKTSQSIVEFRKELLTSKDSFVADAKTDEGRRTRDELQTSNRVKSDLFIPAGGRPNTIDVDNYELSLDDNGQPVFKAIVEGANIFLTHEARLKLEEKGVIIIKDSSANKGGVICSSYEIIASLILSEEEFLDIKKQYAMESIQILKSKARMESKLLFREYSIRNGKVPLTLLSSEISQEINDLTDHIRSILDREEIFHKDSNLLNDKDKKKLTQYHQLIKDHCPPILVEKYGERILTEIPEKHRLSILATQIASYIVYREGLGWISTFPGTNLRKVIEVYLEQNSLVADYTKRILDSDLPGKEVIAKILDYHARKELTRESLQP